MRTRNETLQVIITANYSGLVESVFDTYPGLLPPDPERIISRLVLNLELYDGPADAESFMPWAVEWVREEAERYRFTMMVLTDYDRVIHSAIHQYRWTSTADCAVSHDDVFMEIAALVFMRAHELNRTGTAKLTTRLVALVRQHLMYYHNARNDRRRKLVIEKIDRIPDSIRLSDEEIASMQPATEVYDPGYAVCALN